MSPCTFNPEISHQNYVRLSSLAVSPAPESHGTVQWVNRHSLRVDHAVAAKKGGEEADRLVEEWRARIPSPNNSSCVPLVAGGQ